MYHQVCEYNTECNNANDSSALQHLNGRLCDGALNLEAQKHELNHVLYHHTTNNNTEYHFEIGSPLTEHHSSIPDLALEALQNTQESQSAASEWLEHFLV